MTRLSLVVAITVCAAATAFAESGTWVGTISDSRCGGSKIVPSRKKASKRP
jgi:hypothetical protein